LKLAKVVQYNMSMQKKTISAQDVHFISDILKKYLNPHKQTAFIFGSAAAKKMRRSSDIDIGLEGEDITSETYFSIKQDLEDSNLPFTVDIVRFSEVNDRFKEIAKKDIIPIPITL